MKAISLWQPWASLWLSPRKIHETRHWKTPHRGPLVVHASKRFEKDHPPELAQLLRDQFGARWYATLPSGALLGVVDLVDIETTEDITAIPDLRLTNTQAIDNLLCGTFDLGRFGWRRAPTFQVFKNPIPYAGRQSMFSVPDEIVQEALAA